MDQKNIGKVTIEDYKKAITKNPNLLNIFEFLNAGTLEAMAANTMRE